MKSPFFFFLLIFCFHLRRSAAQPSTIGYPCAANSTTAGYPCHTYAFYRAAPPFLDLASIGDLFSVSRTMISEPSNIPSPSSPLHTGQFLLVPISCGCNYVQNLTYSISFANLTYRIQTGDTFWRVSTYSYGNLTTYQSVEALNPSLVPSNLSLGQDVIFPIFCKCPNQTQLRKGLKWVISYVVQPSDTLASIASKLGANKEDIINMKKTALEVSSTVFVPVSKLPQFKQPNVKVNHHRCT